MDDDIHGLLAVLKALRHAYAFLGVDDGSGLNQTERDKRMDSAMRDADAAIKRVETAR